MQPPTPTANPEEWRRSYRELHIYSRRRRKELSGMLGAYLSVTDDYAGLICGTVEVLGKSPPRNETDRAIRDLLADVFDALYESRRLIIESKLMMAYPLLRRAYESLSLMVACHFDLDMAKRWSAGAQINNAEVRKVLASHPLGEASAVTRELYSFLSRAAHPNRDLVPFRYLGEGNQFVLGAIGQPSLVMVADYCGKHLAMWFWFAASSMGMHHDQIGRAFATRYLEIAARAKTVHAWLIGEFNRLLAERKQGPADPP
jgi:hypothetical protein